MVSMKKSNVLLIVGVILILAALVVYDLRLRSEYKSGAYKDPYRNFVQLPNKDFDVVELLSSTAVNAKLIQGPFKVMIDDGARRFTKVSQQGRVLRISAEFENDYLFNPQPYMLLISCPTLNSLSLNATYLSYGKAVTDTVVREDWKKRQVLLTGFSQDSLYVSQDYGSSLLLDSNHIAHLEARIGGSLNSGAELVIQSSNGFEDAILDIGNRSRLILDKATIKNLEYHLADRAKLVIEGRASNLLNQSKNKGQ